jgi:hypothetical protein
MTREQAIAKQTTLRTAINAAIRAYDAAWNARDLEACDAALAARVRLEDEYKAVGLQRQSI